MSNIKTSKDFASAVCKLIDSIKSDAKGYITFQGKLIESSKGGVNRQFADTTIKSFMDKIRTDLNKETPNAKIGFLELCKSLSSKKSMDEVLTFYYNAKKDKIVLSTESRNKRLAGFSARIVKAFSDVIGYTESNGNKLTLSNTDMLSVIHSAANYYTRNTVKYVKKTKTAKPETTAGTTKQDGTPKPAFKDWVTPILTTMGIEFSALTPTNPMHGALLAQYQAL